MCPRYKRLSGNGLEIDDTAKVTDQNHHRIIKVHTKEHIAGSIQILIGYISDKV